MARSKKGARAQNTSPARSSALNTSAAWSMAGLIAAAAACGGLAVFQWMELLLAHLGQESFCSIDDVFNCMAVWEAPLAKSWQAFTGVPVAGWGLLWALLALIASLWAVSDRLQRADGPASAVAVQIMAGGGLATSVALGGYSLSLGQVCLTCWTTYALVGVYGALTWRLSGSTFASRPAGTALRSAVGVLAVVGVVGYLALRVPGASTPLPGAAEAVTLPEPEAQSEAIEPPGPARSLVARYLAALTPSARRTLGQALAAYRAAPTPSLPAPSPRPFVGSDSAPVRIVDFSDMKCPHCATLAETLHQLTSQFPDEAFRLESRLFPLNGACNPALRPPEREGPHVRCVAAKALICTQGSPKHQALRQQMFREQSSLTVPRVRELVAEVVGREAAQGLESCLDDESTARQLREDIDYATRFDIRGTPMIVVNGRRAPTYPPLLMALILAGGDPNHPAFADLPSS